MSVTLPTSPRPREIAPWLVSQRADVTSIIGAGTQRRERTGDRWSIRVVLPPMSAADALQWQVRLTKAADTCILELPEPGITIGSPGTPLVNAGSQAGSTLITDGWTADYVIKEGKWIAVSVSSLIYLYQCTADTTATGGSASIPIQPMLRASPANDAPLIINPAKIEGYVTFDDGALAISVERIMAGCTFRIEERK
jgi:hypothetical protein